MSRLVVASFASALVGSVLGASLTVALTHDDAALARSRAAQAKLARRLDAVERALAETPAVAPASHAADGQPTSDEPPPSAGTGLVPAKLPVSGPGTLGRDAPGRGADRAAMHEARRQRDEALSNELTLRLGLSPAQTERLRTIQHELALALERQRGEGEGRSGPPEQRRAARQALLRAADAELRAVLAPRQIATYDALDGELKLPRAAR